MNGPSLVHNFSLEDQGNLSTPFSDKDIEPSHRSMHHTGEPLCIRKYASGRTSNDNSLSEGNEFFTVDREKQDERAHSNAGTSNHKTLYGFVTPVHILRKPLFIPSVPPKIPFN